MKKFSFLIAGLLSAFQAGAALSAPNWTVYYNMNYGNGTVPQQTADLYLLNRGVNPVIVFIHGGAWQAGDKSAYAGYYAQLYAMAGFHVVSLNYRLATSDPAAQWNAQLQDVQLAIRWLRQYASMLRIDPTRIGAVGDFSWRSSRSVLRFFKPISAEFNLLAHIMLLQPIAESFGGGRDVWPDRSHSARYIFVGSESMAVQ